MTERSYQDAVQVLKDRLGSRWEGIETEGRDQMVSILRDQLGYDRQAANDAIDAMIDSGELHYHRNTARVNNDVERADPVEPVAPIAPVAAGVPSGGGGMGAVPLAGAVAFAGHWQIGSGEEGEADSPGRKGQVTPRL